MAVTASDEAASLAMQLGGVTERFEALQARVSAARMKGDLEAAGALLQDALDVALAVDNGVGTSSCRLSLASVAKRTGRYDHADELLAENLPFVRARGQTRCEGYTLASMADATVRRGRPGDCAGDALLGGRRALQIGDRGLAVFCLELFALAAAASGDHRRAAATLAAADAAQHEMGTKPDQGKESIRGQTLKLLDQDGEAFALGSAEGRAMDLPAALSLAAEADRTPA